MPERPGARDSYRDKNRHARSCHARVPAGTRRSAERSATVAFVWLGRRGSLLSSRDWTRGAGPVRAAARSSNGPPCHRYPWRRRAVTAPASVETVLRSRSRVAVRVQCGGRRETSKRPALSRSWPSGSQLGSPCSRSRRHAPASARVADAHLCVCIRAELDGKGHTRARLPDSRRGRRLRRRNEG